MRSFEEIAELAAHKGDLYARWKSAEHEARSLGKECHRLIVALDEAKARRSELEPTSKAAWDALNERISEMEEAIAHHESDGNENAALMREYFNRASTAWTEGDKAGAKSLSLIGHDHESKAKEANAAKEHWIKQVQELKQALLNTPEERELSDIRNNIKRLQKDFDEKNVYRIQAKDDSVALEAEFRQAKEIFERADSEPKSVFTDVMSQGFTLDKQLRVGSTRKQYPDYLNVTKVIKLNLDSKVSPDRLVANCAYIYSDNLYVTDGKGNIAFINCEMKHTDDAAAIRKGHGEYRSVGGVNAAHDGMDAGHFGISLGQHPSIAVEQDRIMNRYGAWRKFEQSWDKLSQEGHTVNVIGVFSEDDEESDGTYSPFWCIRETVDGTEYTEYVLTNDDLQS
jgi:hypothetical protein